MKSITVYYSHSGNTRRLAELIADKSGGELWEIIPAKPYPQAYGTVVEQAKKEIQAGFRPALQGEVLDISAYDTVFVGTPNWWSSMAPPVASFLEQAALSGKRVAPFCTHGGGGAGHIRRDMQRLCGGAEILPELALYGGAARGEDVERWLEGF